MERYREGCRCRRCRRTGRLHREVVSGRTARKAATVLTDPSHPGFAQLAALVFTPRMRWVIHRRALERMERDLAASPVRAAEEIDRMSFEQIESLMQPGIPSPAQTRRGGRPVVLIA